MNKVKTVRILFPTMNSNRFDIGGTMITTPLTSRWAVLAGKDKKANPWDYMDDVDYTSQYMLKRGGLFNLTKALNPFSKGNIGNTVAGLATAAAPALGGLISDGYDAGGVGNAIGSIGSTAGSVIGTINPVAGAIVSLGSLAIGGLANRAFGVKTDQQKLNNAKLGINYFSNFKSDATNFDDVKGLQAMANFLNPYKNGWFTSSADGKNASLRTLYEDNKAYALRGIENNVDNIALDLLNNSLSNLIAYGGFMDVDPSTAIGYSIYTDRFIKDNNKNKNKEMANMFAGTPDIFGFGGGIYTKGANFDTGVSYINAGGTHEENPNEGVQMGVDSQGVPNLVEEGEVKWGDYMFSDRLVVPRGKRGNYGKRARKYAEGGKLIKGKGIDTPYESLVLKPYEGLTFAEAAKKIVKRNGADERDDAITMRGVDAQLSVLAGILEKEREKEKLREMQETIDNMSPEEFAMLLQQMEAQQAALQQQEMAMQQLQMIPEGMELMLPVEQQQPIAALGGLLNTPDNMYPYGGNLKLFREDLKDANVSEEDYLRAFYNMRYDKLYEEAQDKDNLQSKEEFVAELLEKFKLSPEEVLNDENFNKDFAETFLNRVETITKQYNRRAKRQGIKVDDLLGATKAQYNRDLSQAILKGLTDADYDVTKDTELTFNNSNISKAKDKQVAYNNAATYNDLIARGGRAVELDDLGRPTWESIAGLNKIDNSAEGFYDNLGELNEDALSTRGVYDYKSSTPSSIANKDDLKLYGWQLGEEGNYAVNKDLVSPNEASRTAGNTNSTYKPSDLGDLIYGAEGYKEALDAIQGDLAYKDLTSYVMQAIKDAEGDYSKLPTDILNYLEYLDDNTGNKEAKLLTRDKDGNITGIADNASQLYDKRRNDNIYGIYHYQFDKGNNAAANRYYYKDGDLNVYISKPEGTDFTISENPTVVTGTDGTLFNDYEVTGLNKNRTLTLLPTGEVVDVTNIDDKDNWKKLDKPVLTDNTDNLGYGIKGTTDWVDYGSSPAGKGIVTENDPFPKAASWPYAIAAGLLLGSLGYNILRPADYSNADAMIKASLSAGTYNPIEFRPIGNYLTYRPDDPWFYTSPIMALANSTLRALANKVSPSKGAETLANSYATMLALGQAQRLQLDNNFNKYAKVGEFNKDTDKFNSEGFLKADMANQDAASRARMMTLEGLKAGYAMRQAIDDAKANAINVGLSGLANLAYNYAGNKYNQDLLGWGMRHNAWGPGISYKGSKGGKIRRKRGIGF